VLDLGGKRVWVAGHRGLVGSALVRRLDSEPIGELITATSAELDLRRQIETEMFVRERQPDFVLVAAARVGGINANRLHQAEFLYDNLMISANVMEACCRVGVQKLVILGSSCVYPREAEQPMTEDSLLSGPLEPTNEGYAIAKIAALELAKMYRREYGMNAISLMPTNLFGPGDNFDLDSSHVLAALVRKIYEAKVSGSPVIEVWGTGEPRRDFLYVDDLADAVVFALEHYEGEQHLNVGTGRDISIRDLAEMIADVAGWSGEFVLNSQMPDGTPRKLLDVGKLRGLGWTARIGLREGLRATYRWYEQHVFDAAAHASTPPLNEAQVVTPGRHDQISS
jgi:GDP-L-fucose synthase